MKKIRVYQYFCKHCGQFLEREFDKRWFLTYCDRTEDMVRVYSTKMTRRNLIELRKTLRSLFPEDYVKENAIEVEEKIDGIIQSIEDSYIEELTKTIE